jgi:hypothetical protein
MRLNEHLGEIVEDTEILNEWTYWVNVFGRPSLTEPWGWQLDGHHVNLNVFVLGGQVVISPVFVGAEPRTCGTGKFARTSVLTGFDEPAAALMEALSGGQRQRAVLHPSILSPLPRKTNGCAARSIACAASSETMASNLMAAQPSPPEPATAAPSIAYDRPEPTAQLGAPLLL